MLDNCTSLDSIIGPPWLGQERNFRNLGAQMNGERHFDIGFCKYIKYLLSFYVDSFLYKKYVVFNFQKLPGFDDVVAKFYLNFLNFQNFGCGISPLHSLSLLRPWYQGINVVRRRNKKLLVIRERMGWCLKSENFLSSCTLERRKMPLFE